MNSRPGIGPSRFVVFAVTVLQRFTTPRVSFPMTSGHRSDFIVVANGDLPQASVFRQITTQIKKGMQTCCCIPSNFNVSRIRLLPLTRHHVRLFDTLVNFALAFVPTVVTAAMQTTTISASMTAYSTAVGPSSDARNRFTLLANLDIAHSFSLCRSRGQCVSQRMIRRYRSLPKGSPHGESPGLSVAWGFTRRCTIEPRSPFHHVKNFLPVFVN